MITREEYQLRRKTLASRLPSKGLAIIPSANEVYRNGDTHYPFRQDSDFYYLTGFDEPHALLMIASSGESVLFNQPNDPLLEQWTGSRLGQEEACVRLGVQTAYPIEEVEKRLPDLLADRDVIFFAFNKQGTWQKKIRQAWKTVRQQLRRGSHPPQAFQDLEPLLSELRLFKSEAEQQLMQQAADITVEGHRQAMRRALHVSYEYQLEAELRHVFIQRGARRVAYDSIVAGGSRACTLHYTQNNQPLNMGDLVLIDAGAEYQHYAADVTRTFPLTGRFSAPQRALYELVLDAQQKAIACVRPDCPWDTLQHTIITTLTQGLIDLGLLKGSLNEMIEKEAYKPFYMHQSGHWLGLDVHDVGRYRLEGQWRTLQPNMVLTVEPGLYIPADCMDVLPQWRGIGIRIEDDILVTKTGSHNLTAALPVSIDEVEALISDNHGR